MTNTSDTDVRQRLVVARVGWCSKYDGSPDDEPRKGGDWNREHIGSEHRNFLPYNGKLYGWVQPPGASLNLGRVGAVPDDARELADVCVAWIATRDGIGQVLVGWYRHAKMYATHDQHGKRGVYNFIAKSRDGTLLHPDDRRLQIPKGAGGTGQANICYARDNNGELIKGAFFDRVRATILKFGNGKARDSKNDAIHAADAVIRGQGFQYDVRFRRLIERHAMARVMKLLKQKYEAVEDRSSECSFDFLCRIGGKERLVEVKGTTTVGEIVLLSRAECELASRERVDLYVVRNIVIEDRDGKPKTIGGTVDTIPDWGRRGFHSKPLGFAVSIKKMHSRRE
jgi:hypothetical protein